MNLGYEMKTTLPIVFIRLVPKNYGLKNITCQQDAGKENFGAKLMHAKVPHFSIPNGLPLLQKWGVF
jgi:hypothetical protein